MGYNDLNFNQTISFTNLQDGVTQGAFTLKTAIPVSNKQVTKAAASTYVNINTNLPSFASKANNQLITKLDLSGVVTLTPYLMYGVAGTAGYKSTDGGNTFTALSGLPSLNWTGIAGDSTGTYIAAICQTQNNQIYISNNGGTSFTAVTISPILIGFYPTGVSMSKNGQYVCVAGCSTTATPQLAQNRNARIATSNDYGASFGAGSYTDGTGVALYNVSGKVAVSGNGQYMTAVFAYRVDPPIIGSNPRPWSFRVYSSNYGATWTKSGGSEFFAFLDIALNDTGQYQFLTSDYVEPGFTGKMGIKAMVSNNYGAGWSEKFSNTTAYYLGGTQNCGFVSATITDDGKTMVGATNGLVYFEGMQVPAISPTVIRSSNYGSSFTSTGGYVGNVGIAGGDVVTTGITDNYIPMLLNNTGQFNYSMNGAITFTPKTTAAHSWSQVYRKAYYYNGSGGITGANWVNNGTTACVSCVATTVYKDTNIYSSTVNQYKIGLTGTAQVADPTSACNTTANYSTLWGHTYSCSNGTVTTTADVYKNSNICFTGNQYKIGSTTYATDPSESAPSTVETWVVAFGQYECDGCTQYFVEINNNSCSSTYNTTRRGQVRYQSTTNCDPCCGQSTAAQWTVVFGSEWCVGCDQYFKEVDLNPCSPTHNQERTSPTVQYNTTNCGGCCGQSTASNWTILFGSHSCGDPGDCNLYYNEVDLGPCSPTKDQIRRSTAVYQYNSTTCCAATPTCYTLSSQLVTYDGNGSCYGQYDTVEQITLTIRDASGNPVPAPTNMTFTYSTDWTSYDDYAGYNSGTFTGYTMTVLAGTSVAGTSLQQYTHQTCVLSGTCDCYGTESNFTITAGPLPQCP